MGEGFGAKLGVEVRPRGQGRLGSGGDHGALAGWNWDGKPPPEGQALLWGTGCREPRAVCPQCWPQWTLRCHSPCDSVPRQGSGSGGRVLWEHPLDQCWAPYTPGGKQ